MTKKNINLCDFDHCGRCHSPDRLDDECDPRCPLYRECVPPKDPSHDPGRFLVRVRELVRKAYKFGQKKKDV